MIRRVVVWVGVLVVLAGVFVGLRVVYAVQPEPSPSAIFTSKVVVVGVEGLYRPTAADLGLIEARAADVQVGAVSVRPRYEGDCSTAGWTTLGAGRRAAVGGLCEPAVADGRVDDWGARLAAAGDRNGDAQLGTLANSVSGCVGAVGPNAAVAAAMPDGTVEHYAPVESFDSGGYRLDCPITLVDAGAQSDRVISALAQQSDVTLIVTGIGPVAGSDDPRMQVAYRIGTTLPGWFGSQSTRREGVFVLTDLTRTLIDFGADDQQAVPVDGAALEVWPREVRVPELQDQMRSLDALSYASTPVFLGMGAVGTLIAAGMVITVWRRRFGIAQVLGAVGVVLINAMMLTGIYPWQESSHPSITLGVVLIVVTAVLAAGAMLIARWRKIPIAVAAAGLTVAAFTIDAALGGMMQPGSLLNSRPTYGGRWYGFGNVTFSAYAQAGLVLAGWLALRQAQGTKKQARWLPAVVVLAVGGLVIICEGWPSMGSDFGGVIALTPGVLWLAFAVSGVRTTAPRLAGIAAAAVLAVAAISYLDWSRPPAARSHLGNFVQRIIDGDAFDVVARKAVTAVETMTSPLGLGSIVVGVVAWVLILRILLPQLETDFGTRRPVAVAVLATTILGTVLNDGGISVWITLTSVFVLTILSLWFARVAKTGSVSFRGRHSSERK